MPKTPQPANNPDKNYSIVIQIPGWLKNQLLTHTQKHNTTINKWVALQIREALRQNAGLPPPPPAAAPIPTKEQILRSYLSGEKILTPCGKTDCTIDIEQIQEFKFCKNCGIRVQ